MLVLTLQCGLETVAVSTDDQSVVDFESDDTRHMEAILEAPTNQRGKISPNFLDVLSAAMARSSLVGFRRFCEFQFLGRPGHAGFRRHNMSDMINACNVNTVI